MAINSLCYTPNQRYRLAHARTFWSKDVAVEWDDENISLNSFRSSLLATWCIGFWMGLITDFLQSNDQKWSDMKTGDASTLKKIFFWFHSKLTNKVLRSARSFGSFFKHLSMQSVNSGLIFLCSNRGGGALLIHSSCSNTFIGIDLGGGWFEFSPKIWSMNFWSGGGIG